jgi:hypothetical protein
MAMLTSHVAFALIGLASLLLGWPLARRRVPPNRCLVFLVIALGLSFVRGLPELGYIGICMAVFVVGSIRATVRGIRVVKRRSVN